MKTKPNLAVVLKTVNRARKAMGLKPLKRMPRGFIFNPVSPLSRALEASGVCTDSHLCDPCSYVSAKALFPMVRGRTRALPVYR